MPAPGTPTLDQLTVLTAVADEGGLAAAARRLKRATSAVSYAIDTLEAQLGLKLFDRVTTRRPRLTPEGAAVLADARALLARMDELKARVRDLSEGLEAEVALAVDVMLPTERLVDALTAFRDAFPTVALRLHVEALGGVTQLVAGGKAVIGINNPMHDDIGGLETVSAGAVPKLSPRAALCAARNRPCTASARRSISRARSRASARSGATAIRIMPVVPSARSVEL